MCWPLLKIRFHAYEKTQPDWFYEYFNQFNLLVSVSSSPNRNKIEIKTYNKLYWCNKIKENNIIFLHTGMFISFHQVIDIHQWHKLFTPRLNKYLLKDSGVRLISYAKRNLSCLGKCALHEGPFCCSNIILYVVTNYVVFTFLRQLTPFVSVFSSLWLVPRPYFQQWIVPVTLNLHWVKWTFATEDYLDGWVQDYGNSIANALESLHHSAIDLFGCFRPCKWLSV